MRELRLFQIVVGAVLVIPLVAGPTGAFGGLDGMAALFGEDRTASLSPALRNHLRAITWMFTAIVPLVVWSLRRMEERAGAFRIIIAFAFVAGFARLAGRFVDGDPGSIATVFTALELGLMPLVVWWHARLIRLG
jgi:hypothetical protein